MERDAIFKRAWLNVGRVEQLPRKGSYFTKELKVANTSIILVRTGSGEIKAYHNVCRHRGNKLVWNDMPLEETRGVCRQFTCKYHAWRYDLDGNLTFVQQEEEFFDLDKSRYGLVTVHCEVWEGFIFVNFAKTPEQSLREFLGPMVTDAGGLPLRQDDLALVLPLGSQGQLEALHGRVPGVLSRTGAAREPVADGVFKSRRRGRISKRRTIVWTARTVWSARRECGPGRWPPRCANRSRTSARADYSGRGTNLTWADARRTQPGEMRSVGAGFIPALPQLRHPVLGPGLVSDLPLLADVVQLPHLRGHAVFPGTTHPARTGSAGTGGGVIQGIRAAGRQHAGSNPDA